MKRIPAIAAFLKSKANPDLAALFHSGLEVQVNAAPDGGTRISGEYKGSNWHGWKDEATGETWKSFRIPYNAWDKPEYMDKALTWDLDKHADSIGLTGFNYLTKRSEFFVYDFDSVANHKANALTDVEMNAVLDSVKKVDWITVRRSKSGRGVHLYVQLEDSPEILNHTEHAALARSVLGMMAAASGADLHGAVDCFGNVAWVWHRDAAETGFELLKKGKPLSVDKVPGDWRVHVDVVTKRKTRNVPKSAENEFEALIRQVKKIELDADHQRLLAWFVQQDGMTLYSWEPLDGMLQCHTFDLARAHKDLGLKGLFYTISSGKDRPDQNCFAFPMPNGVWSVRRHGKNIAEHASWTKDPSGWTRCELGAPPTLGAAARAHEGTMDLKGVCHFSDLAAALKSIGELGLGVDAKAVQNYLGRKAQVLSGKGRICVRFERNGDESVPSGWIKSKSWWERFFDFQEIRTPLEIPDELVRSVATEKGTDAGFYVWTAHEKWVAHNKQNVVSYLGSKGIDPAAAQNYVGVAIDNYWLMVNKPFQGEYPGNREWNLHGAQLAYEAKEGPHPTWDKIFEHLGVGLDDGVKRNEWCKKHGVVKGADYLRLWVACMFQYPTQRLPYLFFHSMEQESGKSSLHEALSFLFKENKGYVKVTEILKNGDHNGPISGAVLCVTEELDLRENKNVYDLLKDLITADRITIRPIYEAARDEQNCTHWMQCANRANYCPINDPNDTRFVVVSVGRIKNAMSNQDFKDAVKAEAAGFLYDIMKVEVPPPPTRLRIPAVMTSSKEDQQEANKTHLQRFMDDRTTHAQGMILPWGDFYDKFLNSVEPMQRQWWSMKRVRSELPTDFPRGKYGPKNDIQVGNIRWKDTPEKKGLKRLIRTEDKLVAVDD